MTNNHAPGLLRAMAPDAVPSVGRFLSKLFSTRLILSTLFSGSRPSGLDPAMSADLETLAAAIEPVSVLTNVVDRDAASPEPAMVTFIRQVEGRQPAVVASLRAPNETSLEAALTEAAALGLSPKSAPPRQLGIVAHSECRVLDAGAGLVIAGAAARWSDIEAVATPAGLGHDKALTGRFATPLAAAQAGILKRAQLTTVHGQPWTVKFILPLAGSRLSERTWRFPSYGTAIDVAKSVARRFAPLFMETISGVDAGVAAAAGLWKPHDVFRGPSGGALRVVFDGPPITRRAALAEASWAIERAGGTCHHRSAPASPLQLEALAAAAGAARVTLPEGSAAAVPDGAIVAPSLSFVRGQPSSRRIVWYPRDLTRSVDEALELFNPHFAAPAVSSETDPMGSPHQVDVATGATF